MSIPRQFLLFAAVILLGTGPSARAADPSPSDALTPDRPGFTNGSDTVPPGRVQVEMGITRTKDAAEAGGTQTTDYPQMLLRTGLNEQVEMRVTLPDYVSPSGGETGFGDGAIGLRYKFYQSRDGNTKMALTPTLSIPIKSAVTASGHVDPSVTLSAQTTSGARWGLASNLSLSYPTTDGRRITDYTASAAVQYQISGPLAVYGDIYRDAPTEGPPVPIADGGFTYRLAPNVQLDLETGRGLGGGAPVQFYGGGIVVGF